MCSHKQASTRCPLEHSRKQKSSEDLNFAKKDQEGKLTENVLHSIDTWIDPPISLAT